jgi:hypothetical protein
MNGCDRECTPPNEESPKCCITTPFVPLTRINGAFGSDPIMRLEDGPEPQSMNSELQNKKLKSLSKKFYLP